MSAKRGNLTRPCAALQQCCHWARLIQHRKRLLIKPAAIGILEDEVISMRLRILRSATAPGCLALALMLFAVSCGGPSHTVTLEDDGETITISHPSRLYVILDANPDSEYFWVLDRLNQGVLRFRSKELVKLDRESKFGGNRFRKFTFETVNAGKTRMEIDFSSLFEDDEEGDDIDTFHLTVVVE